MTRAFAIALVAALGCGQGHHDDHGGGHHDDHTGDELPAQSVTVWTARSELFAEYPPLVVGTESTFLAHVTVLEGFTPLDAATVTVRVTMADGSVDQARVEAPARPGIFTPAITPGRAGDCTLALEIAGPSLTDRIDAGPCRVFADAASARAAAAEHADTGRVSFLKEQQWVIDFATVAAAPREVQAGIRVNAEIRAVPDREVRLTASTAGRVALPTPVPIIGSAVTRGQLLASIQPMVAAAGNLGALSADVDAARAELTAATSQRDRLAALVAQDAVPRRRLDDAEAALSVAEARLAAARTRIASYRASASGAARAGAGAFRIRAPIAGTLVAVHATQGETVNAGELLFEVIDLDRVWVTGRVFEADLAALERAPAAWFQVEGRDDVFELGAGAGELVTVGSVIDPRTRTAPVVYEVDNSARQLRIGQFATLTIATGKPVTGLAVPESALLQEGAQWIAYVQVEGESFERRLVRPGVRSRGWVHIESGIAAGERVVSTGAYDIKLAASASDAPAHGHSH